MMRIFPATVIAALVALPVPVQAQSAPHREAIVQAMLAVDCVVTLETEDAVQAATGLTEAEMNAAAGAMFAEGMFEETQFGLTLLHPDCPNGGVATPQTGVQEAIAWMGGLEADRAADVLAEVLTVRGCQVGDHEFELFEGEVATLVASRFGFEVPEVGRPEYVAFFDALDRMGELGGETLFARGEIEAVDGVNRLIDCDAVDASVAATIALAETPTMTGAALFNAILDAGEPGVHLVESQVIASLGCRVPVDMGFAFSAMVMEVFLTYIGFNPTTERVLEVMAEYRTGIPSTGPLGTELALAAELVSREVAGMEEAGRARREGDVLIATACEPVGSQPEALVPYLTGRR